MFQSGLFDEAFKNTTQVTDENLKEKVLQLQSAIRYSNEDYAGAQSVLLQRKVSHESTLNDEGCLLYQVRILYDFFPGAISNHNRLSFAFALQI